MKKFILWILMCCMLLSITGCGSHSPKQAANELVEAFNRSNIEEIDRIVFGDDPSLSDFPELSEDGGADTGSSLLDQIFARVSLSVDSVTEDVIVYEILSPNMEQVFHDFLQSHTDITEYDMILYLEEYIENTELKKYEVSVPYTADDQDQLIIDYRTESFLNAITGGLVNAYRDLYLEALNEYREEEN